MVWSIDIVIHEWPLEADWDGIWFLHRSYSVTRRQNSQEKTVTEMKCRHYYYFIASLIILEVSVSGINYTRAGNEKVFNVFQVTKFPNDECTASDTKVVVMSYKSEKCLNGLYDRACV